MSVSRRAMVAGLATLATAVTGRPRASAASAASGARSSADEGLLVPADVPPERLAADEVFWRSVARQYRVSADFINLENGYYGIRPEPVRLAYHRNTDDLNERNSHLLRTTFKARADQVRQRIAAVLGVRFDEIAFDPGRHGGVAVADRRLSAAAPWRRGHVRGPGLSQRALRDELAA